MFLCWKALLAECFFCTPLAFMLLDKPRLISGLFFVTFALQNPTKDSIFCPTPQKWGVFFYPLFIIILNFIVLYFVFSFLPIFVPTKKGNYEKFSNHKKTKS